MKFKLIESIDDSFSDLFTNDNGLLYKVIDRSNSRTNALLKDKDKWIIAIACPEDEGTWKQAHYFFDKDEVNRIWKSKYKEE